jgi:hypothetical protein
VAARAALTAAEIAIRQVRAGAAEAALAEARAAAEASAIPALIGEVATLHRSLRAPSARIVRAGTAVDASLGDVEALLAADRLVVDACRRAVRGRAAALLASRPVLFAIARALAEAWPAPADRDGLITRVFAARVINPSHRARLRVEVGRLRAALRGIAAIEATATGFALVVAAAAEVVVLAPLVDGESGEVRALLADGEAWSTSALARALGASQRTVQRALRELEAGAHVRSVGRGRARRWLAPSPSGFATPLLLPGALPIG